MNQNLTNLEIEEHFNKTDLKDLKRYICKVADDDHDILFFSSKTKMLDFILPLHKLHREIFNTFNYEELANFCKSNNLVSNIVSLNQNLRKDMIIYVLISAVYFNFEHQPVFNTFIIKRKLTAGEKKKLKKELTVRLTVKPTPVVAVAAVPEIQGSEMDKLQEQLDALMKKKDQLAEQAAKAEALAKAEEAHAKNAKKFALRIEAAKEAALAKKAAFAEATTVAEATIDQALITTDQPLSPSANKRALPALPPSAVRRALPVAVRDSVWNLYIGEDINKHRCLCCKKVLISNRNFQVGHVQSVRDGGTDEINNLRPICAPCNHSMSTQNMIEFVKTYGYFIG